jgi:lysozyme
MSDLIDRIVRHEGFRAKPYQDSLDVWTIGHGLTYLTEEESRYIVTGRVHKTLGRLYSAHEWLRLAPSVVAEVLAEMTFQLGWTGCHKFVKMLENMEKGFYTLASIEMLDSKWAEQTPERAKELAAMIRLLDESSNS